MNVCDKYNKMIDTVENGVEIQSTSDDILEQLTSTGLCDKRVLAEIFKFMTGMSVMEYIKERQLMRAYRCLVEDGGEINKAIDFSGLANHSSFDKKFKGRFGLTPKEARQRRDKKLYQEPLTWSVISNGSYAQEDKSMSETSAPRMKFGIEQEKLEKYNDAMEMQALYGFTDAETEIAFDFAVDANIPMKKAFEYIDAGIESWITDGDKYRKAKQHWSKDEIWRVTRYASMLRYICERSTIPFKKADYLVFVIQNHIGDINNEPIEGIVLFEKYMEKFFDYGEFKTVYDHFVTNDGDMIWWEEYVQCISNGIDYEDAFDIAKQEHEEFEDWIDACYSDAYDDNLF